MYTNKYTFWWNVSLFLSGVCIFLGKVWNLTTFRHNPSLWAIVYTVLQDNSELSNDS